MSNKGFELANDQDGSRVQKMQAYALDHPYLTNEEMTSGRMMANMYDLDNVFALSLAIRPRPEDDKLVWHGAVSKLSSCSDNALLPISLLNMEERVTMLRLCREMLAGVGQGIQLAHSTDKTINLSCELTPAELEHVMQVKEQ